MWQNELNNEKDDKGQSKYETIYLDAWENDYHQDPIIPLIGALNPYLELENAKNADVKKAVIVIIKQLVKILTSFDVDSVLGDMEKQVETQSRNDLNIFNNLEGQKKLIKEELQKVSENKKVFFFIDELDRCKPLFAINLLERIKHFLDIPNFVFIFSMDMSQLTPSIKKVYGEIEVDKYFRKFFDLVFHLPMPKVDKYFNFLFTSNELSNIINSDYISVIREVIVFHDNLSLRECEKIFNIIRISNFKIKDYESGYFREYIIPYFILLKVLNQQEYSDCKTGKKDWNFDLINEWILENKKVDDDTKKYIQEQFSIFGKKNIKAREAELIRQGKNKYSFRQSLNEGFSEIINELLEFSDSFK